MEDDQGFILIGAGLPRTGTTSTRAALSELLHGDIYHMKTVDSDHQPFWKKVLDQKASLTDWKKTMADYKGGVDYPVSFFYKELMVAYPKAKVLLNVRDPVKWYQSVNNTIGRVHKTTKSWPCTWFMILMGQWSGLTWGDMVPSCSSSGLSMMEACAAGEQSAVQFYHDHVNEVRAHVPAERLLVWEVKEGWAPICKFLGVPVPDIPFPRLNDTAEMIGNIKGIERASWTIVVFIPITMAAAAYYFKFSAPTQYLGLFGGYLLVIGLLRFISRQSLRNRAKAKKL